jgi:hypothetical protein
VDHLDVVAGTSGTNPVAAGLTLGLCRDILENVLDMGPGVWVATGHERRAVTGTLLTTGDTRANKEDALLLELLKTTVRVGEIRVTTIDDDVTGLKVLEELVDEVVNSVTSLDEQNNTTGLLELFGELLDRMSTENALTLGLVGQEVVDLGGSTVVGNNRVAVVGYVEDQVLGLAIYHDTMTAYSRVLQTYFG